MYVVLRCSCNEDEKGKTTEFTYVCKFRLNSRGGGGHRPLLVVVKGTWLFDGRGVAWWSPGVRD